MLLLEAHPQAKTRRIRGAPNRSMRSVPRGSPYSQTLLDAIITGTVPEDVSLWVAVTGRGGAPDPEFHTVVLQRTERADGRGGIGRSRYKAFDLLGTDLMAQFQLVHHPLHDFQHPYEPHGLVARCGRIRRDILTCSALRFSMRLHVYTLSSIPQSMTCFHRSCRHPVVVAPVRQPDSSDNRSRPRRQAQCISRDHSK